MYHVMIMATIALLLGLFLQTGHGTALTAEQAVSQGQLLLSGSGTVVAQPHGTHNYQLYRIDLTNYTSGILEVEVKTGNGASGLSYDLYASEGDVPTTGRPVKSLKGGYDVRPNRISQIRYKFSQPCQLILGIEGNWLSKAGTTNTYTFQASIQDVRGSSSGLDNGAQKRLFFYICYLNDDKADLGKYQSFPDAAKTWMTEAKGRYTFRDKSDVFFEGTIRSVDNFLNAWNEIRAIAEREKRVIVGGAIFSHASTTISSQGLILNTGLEFGVDPSGKGLENTVSKEAIERLAVLPWDKAGSLELFGCNTGVKRPPLLNDWCPADAFAKRQRVTTWGEAGFAYFSRSKDKYVRIVGNDPQVYLHAYNRYIRGILGDGKRKPPIMFLP